MAIRLRNKGMSQNSNGMTPGNRAKSRSKLNTHPSARSAKPSNGPSTRKRAPNLPHGGVMSARTAKVAKAVEGAETAKTAETAKSAETAKTAKAAKAVNIVAAAKKANAFKRYFPAPASDRAVKSKTGSAQDASP